MTTATKHFSKQHMRSNEDWYGNNIAVPCPCCGETYISSGMIDKRGRECPKCKRSILYVSLHGDVARIQWDIRDEKKIA